MRALLCLFLLGCDGTQETTCVTDAATMSCDDGGVLLYTLGDGQLGTFTACTACTAGSLCMFQHDGVFIGGVCR